MNIYDILIGIVIGVALERATKISFAIQKMIAEAKKKQREEKARKAALIKSEEQK